jgi:hypothetical protein
MFSQFKYKEISLKTSGISPGRIIYRIKELRASKMHELKEYDYNQHDRTIMETIEGNFFLSFIKASINKFLALTSLGDTLKFIFQKM